MKRPSLPLWEVWSCPTSFNGTHFYPAFKYFKCLIKYFVVLIKISCVFKFSLFSSNKLHVTYTVSNTFLYPFTYICYVVHIHLQIFTICVSFNPTVTNNNWKLFIDYATYHERNIFFALLFEGLVLYAILSVWHFHTWLKIWIQCSIVLMCIYFKLFSCAKSVTTLLLETETL